MESTLIPLQKAASEAGITLDKARHWGSQLGFTLEKVNRVRHIREDDAAVLVRMARMVAGGMSPIEAATTLKYAPDLTPQTASQSPQDPAPNDDRFAGIERSILSLVEVHKVAAENHGKEIATLREMVAGLVEENRALRSEVAGVRLAIMPPSDPPRQVQPWQPIARPDPAAGLSWVRRAWLELTAPEQLRRMDS